MLKITEGARKGDFLVELDFDQWKQLARLAGSGEDKTGPVLKEIIEKGLENTKPHRRY